MFSELTFYYVMKMNDILLMFWNWKIFNCDMRINNICIDQKLNGKEINKQQKKYQPLK